MKEVLKSLHNKVLLRSIYTLTKYSYADQDVQVIDCYRSKNHGLILSIIIKNVSKPDGDSAYFAKAPHWFYISKDFSTKFLGTGISPIEIADIDHDRRTEFMFLYSELDDPDNDGDSDNTNGYILFYNDFKQSVRFLWNNH